MHEIGISEVVTHVLSLTLVLYTADLHALTIECQVKVMAQLLQDLVEDSIDVVHHVLLQFQVWYHVALFLALTGTESVSHAQCVFSRKTDSCRHYWSFPIMQGKVNMIYK